MESGRRVRADWQHFHVHLYVPEHGAFIT